MSIPPKPDEFTFTGAPAGVEVKFINFLDERPLMRERPRAIGVHTNAARGEGSLESAWNFAHAAPNSNTIPTYQVDRTHNGVTRARKMIPSNVRGIANATVLPTTKDSSGNLVWPTLTETQRANILQHPVSSREWALAIETADTGTDDDPAISDFDDGQVEVIAQIIAYEAIACDFPIIVPGVWFGAGVFSHTDPYPYPYHTIKRGKSCPGDKKKATVRNRIIPRAAEIYDAWIAPPAPPEEDDDDMTFTEDDRAQLKAVHDALLVRDPHDGTSAMVTKVNQIHTIMSSWWDGAPGNIVDGAGSLARTLKSIAVKVGARVG